MAHMISLNARGEAEAAFGHGTPAWHGLGTTVPAGMTPAEALELARLAWTVERAPLYLADGTKVPDRVANVRSDGGRYLATVGTGYRAVQHAEQAAIIEALIGEGANIDAVGALDEGRRQFWTVRVPGDLVIDAKGGKDAIRRNLILANGHDGSLALRIFWSPVRVVCNNTLTAALSDAKDGVNIRHTTNAKDRIDEARKTLRIASAYFGRLQETAQQLAERDVLAAEVEHFLDSVFPMPPEPATMRQRDAVRDVRGKVRSNLDLGAGAELSGRTAWGLWNAATEFVSHQRPARGKDMLAKREARFESVMLGAGRATTEKALAAALHLVHA